MRLGMIGLVYALDNLVYFYALSNLGAATYCVLAQTKIFFTAFFLRLRGLAKKFSRQQIIGLSSSSLAPSWYPCAMWQVVLQLPGEMARALAVLIEQASLRTPMWLMRSRSSRAIAICGCATFS